ncbi:hypothetical protein Tco_0052003 [Tanacetum coccineum]
MNWQCYMEKSTESQQRNVRLWLAADGSNPIGTLVRNLPHVAWPVILTTYNLPPWLCMKESSFMLTLLIPGPKSPGKDIDVYLRPLIDDLKVLWAKPGVETIDVATGLKFNMRAMVLWTINDFPARSSLSGWSGQGYKACPTCNEDTPSVRVLGKTAYVGHRRFLKKPHKWRRSLEFNGETENRDPPREFSRDAIMTQLARLPTRVKGKHPRSVKRTRQCPGVNESSELFSLALTTQTPISVTLAYDNGVRFGPPSLTCVPTWNPTAGYKSMRASSGTCKRSTMAKRLLSKKDIRMRSLHFGMIPRTLPGLPKINKTGQRARSYAVRDPDGTSATNEYPSLIHTFFLVTILMVELFLTSEDKALLYLISIESQPEYGGGSGSGGGAVDDEPGDDEDGGEVTT